jgi:ferrochelatase
VEPFLERLFSDPAIMPLPSALRRRIAGLVAGRRGPSARERYALLGGASPIHAWTEAQVEALSARLGKGYEVRHVFRYARPRAGTVADDLAAAGVRRVVALSSYPQRSFTTTDSSLADLQGALDGRGTSVRAVTSYPVDAGFIRSLASGTADALSRAGAGARVIYAAHSIPKRSVRRGDPYTGQVERTVRALARTLPAGVVHHLAYQSRVGPVGWQGPSLASTLRRLGAEGVRSVVVVPVSFTTENLETLVELDLEARETGAMHGIGDFHRAPAPGVHPAFIDMLARLALAEVGRG